MLDVTLCLMIASYKMLISVHMLNVN